MDDRLDLAAVDGPDHCGELRQILLNNRKLIIASNRGPVTFHTDAQGQVQPQRGGALSAQGRRAPLRSSGRRGEPWVRCSIASVGRAHEYHANRHATETETIRSPCRAPRPSDDAAPGARRPRQTAGFFLVAVALGCHVISVPLPRAASLLAALAGTARLG